MKTMNQDRAVLVVEDDPLVRLDAALALSDAGFTVIEAGTADEALEILSGPQSIALVFTDIEMPGRHSGLDLAEIVKEKHPQIPVLVASGRMTAAGISATRFFAKPYDLHDVIDRARTLIAA